MEEFKFANYRAGGFVVSFNEGKVRLSHEDPDNDTTYGAAVRGIFGTKDDRTYKLKFFDDYAEVNLRVLKSDRTRGVVGKVGG